jgi:hypothetical protein
MATQLPQIDIVEKGNRAFAILQQSLAPGKLATSQKNVDALYEWTSKRYKLHDPSANAEGIASVLLEAVEALYFNPGLDWEVQPSKFLVDKWQQNATQRMAAIQIKKDADARNDNSEAAFWARQKAAEDTKAKEAADKKAEVVKQAIHSTIMTVEIYSGPNRVDHGESEKTRQYLFNFVAHRRNQRVSDEKILKELREVINPGVNDIYRELVRRWETVPAEEQQSGGRDSLGGDVRKIGKLGSIR